MMWEGGSIFNPIFHFTDYLKNSDLLLPCSHPPSCVAHIAWQSLQTRAISCNTCTFLLHEWVTNASAHVMVFQYYIQHCHKLHPSVQHNDIQHKLLSLLFCSHLPCTVQWIALPFFIRKMWVQFPPVNFRWQMDRYLNFSVYLAKARISSLKNKNCRFACWFVLLSVLFLYVCFGKSKHRYKH